MHELAKRVWERARKLLQQCRVESNAPMSSIDLYFVREDDYLRCYAFDGTACSYPRLPNGATVVEIGDCLSGCFGEILNDERQIIGFYGFVHPDQIRHAAIFEDVSNARIVQENVATYVIALATTEGILDEIEARYRAGEEGGHTWGSCAFDIAHQTSDGLPLLQVAGWYAWTDRARGILRIDCGGRMEEPVFCRPIPILN